MESRIKTVSVPAVRARPLPGTPRPSTPRRHRRRPRDSGARGSVEGSRDIARPGSHGCPLDERGDLPDGEATSTDFILETEFDDEDEEITFGIVRHVARTLRREEDERFEH